MSDFMYVNLHLSGELEKFVNELVERGIVATKTEAIRLAVLKYYEIFHPAKKEIEHEPFSQSTIDAHWNNPSDEKSAEFYKKKYLNE